MSDAMLEMTGIVRRFEQGGAVLEVLRGADLAVQPGELVALVGPSGAGKSTLLQIAGLLERPTEGIVRIAGADVSDFDDGKRTEVRRRSIGFVYQFHHLLPEFSAQENIVLPQMIAGVSKRLAKQRADELLHMVGLDARGSHRPARLSGGEQQRVAVARALLQKPAWLYLDEATSACDPETEERLYGLLRDRLPATAIVSVGHRASLIAHHDRHVAVRRDDAPNSGGALVSVS